VIVHGKSVTIYRKKNDLLFLPLLTTGVNFGEFSLESSVWRRGYETICTLFWEKSLVLISMFRNSERMGVSKGANSAAFGGEYTNKRMNSLIFLRLVLVRGFQVTI